MNNNNMSGVPLHNNFYMGGVGGVGGVGGAQPHYGQYYAQQPLPQQYMTMPPNYGLQQQQQQQFLYQHQYTNNTYAQQSAAQYAHPTYNYNHQQLHQTNHHHNNVQQSATTTGNSSNNNSNSNTPTTDTMTTTTVTATETVPPKSIEYIKFSNLKNQLKKNDPSSLNTLSNQAQDFSFRCSHLFELCDHVPNFRLQVCQIIVPRLVDPENIGLVLFGFEDAEKKQLRSEFPHLTIQ